MNTKPLNATSKVALALITSTSIAAIALVIQFWSGQPTESHVPWQAAASLALGPVGPTAAAGYLHGYWMPFAIFMGGAVIGSLLLVFSLRQPRS